MNKTTKAVRKKRSTAKASEKAPKKPDNRLPVSFDAETRKKLEAVSEAKDRGLGYVVQLLVRRALVERPELGRDLLTDDPFDPRSVG